MKLINRSGWNTRDLKTLSSRILSARGHKIPHTLLIVEQRRKMKYSNPEVVNGLAQVKGGWVKMTLPPVKGNYYVHGEDGMGRWIVKDVVFPTKEYAQVLCHEVGHNEGLLHKDMVDWRSIPIPSEVLSLQVRPKKEVVPPTLNEKRDARKREYEAKLKEIASKTKRLKNMEKKYQRKLNYILKKQNESNE